MHIVLTIIFFAFLFFKPRATLKYFVLPVTVFTMITVVVVTKMTKPIEVHNSHVDWVEFYRSVPESKKEQCKNETDFTNYAFCLGAPKSLIVQTLDNDGQHNVFDRFDNQ